MKCVFLFFILNLIVPGFHTIQIFALMLIIIKPDHNTLQILILKLIISDIFILFKMGGKITFILLNEITIILISAANFTIMNSCL
ncbi:hypothetical protein EG339_10220 [Chryseobacterium bernardetii]|uniref:Uncharacterized protein n=1 Tax=Chryseobacterium bernardetii TaxID=1241978 RepID=A0A3G6T6L7_9FLAO|nr:hypothetical protein EG339_10220 [Chryseobacterium bernardetii]